MSALRRVISHQLSVISLVLFLLLFTANLFIFTTPVFAADCNVAGIGDWCPLGEKNYDDEIAVQRFGQNIFSFGYATMFGRTPTGGDIITTKKTSKIENGKEVISYVPGLSKGNINNGALAMVTQGVIALYNPPTSSMEYLANLGENIGLSPKIAHAQVGGSGESVINPVLALWKVVRNIAYAGFILVFITTGLMIMFRQKLNPQTVIGIQQALPGLVIGLILVTFSYFIAAFIVDITFVGMKLVATVFESAQTSNYYAEDRTATNPNGTFNQVYQKSDAFEMYGRPATRIQNGLDVFKGVWGILNPIKDPALKFDFNDFSAKTGIGAGAGCTIGIFAFGIGCIIGGVVGGLVGAIQSVTNINAGAVAGGVVISTLSAILVPLILAIALMIQFIRLIIALLMSYIQILIMVIAGPIFILISAIPGRGGILSYWFKSLLANALVFPAVFAGFLFAGILLNYTFTSNASMPLFGGIETNILGTLLAFGVLLGLPSIPEMVRNALGVKGPQGFTQAAIGGFMGGVAAGRTGIGKVTEGAQKKVQAYEGAKLEGEAKGTPVTATAAGTPTGREKVLSWFGGKAGRK